MSSPEDIIKSKQKLRSQLRLIRKKQDNKDELSTRIFEKLLQATEYREAKSVLYYVDVRDEIRTQHAIRNRLAATNGCIVPYCQNGDLKLCRIRDFSELERGKFGILEPSLNVCADSSRRIDPSKIEVALIPGLGFSSHGQRIGYGEGYYDRLLAKLRTTCLKIGLAFDCQIVPEIPTDAHDLSVDWVVTELRIFVCRSADK